MTSPFLFAQQGLQILSKQSGSITHTAAGGDSVSSAVTPIDTDKALLILTGIEADSTSNERVPSLYPDTIVSDQYTEVTGERRVGGTDSTVYFDLYEIINIKSLNYYQKTGSGALAITEVDPDKSIIIPNGYGQNGFAGSALAACYFSASDEITFTSNNVEGYIAVLELA